MKQEFSQMAFDFPMAEPQAPSKNGSSAHHGESGNGASGNGLGLSGNSLSLSAEEEHVVREEGRRAGVVVRIKSLKRPVEQTAAPQVVSVATITPLVAPIVEAPPAQPKSPGKVFVQTSIPLGDIDLPLVNADIPDIPETADIPHVKEEPVIDGQTKKIAPDTPVEETLIEETLIEDTPVEETLVEETPVAELLVEEPAIVSATISDPEVLPAAPVEEPPLPRRSPRTKPTEKKKPAPVEKIKSKRGRKSLKEIAAEADLIDIPADEILFSKQYYTMGEVAEMFHVNQSLLRFWETEFSILQPRKNRKGDRYFRPVDIKNLHLIYHLLRQRKYTIEGAKEFLRKNKKADQRFEAIQRLQQIKAFLLELKAQL